MEVRVTTYRIYEIDGLRRTVAGWGDHASIASAKEAVARWGRIYIWELDTDHDAVDALIMPHNKLAIVQITVEPIVKGESKEWTTQ